MRKSFFKKLVIICLGVSVVVSGAGVSIKDVKAATAQCTTYTGDNVENQNYKTWSSVINSYLDKCSNGDLMRVQAGALDSGILVEYYDSSYNIKRTVNVTDGLLPVFGGFYSTGTNYYVVSGQNNPEESDSVEVYRITKYDLNWNVLGYDGLLGANTYIPFDAGSLRMTSSGKYLLVRTCHEMYTSSDGLHHQANVTIQFDMDEMKIKDSYTEVMNKYYGYVSHSFNQFIRTDGTSMVGVDHGDAHPRSIVLIKYKTDFTTGSFTPGYYTRCNVVDLMAFPEATSDYHYNYTGASVGGFELSADNYIVVGNTVDQSNVTISGTRNIFVATVDRSISESPEINYITSYAEGTASASTPHLIKLSDSRFIVMWSRDEMVYWTAIDGDGKQNGSIYNMEGSLSDCVPIVYNDKLIWYVWYNDKLTFYDISTRDLALYSATEIVNGHDDIVTKAATIADNNVTVACNRCGSVRTMSVPTGLTVYGKPNTSTDGYYWTCFKTEYKVGEYVDFLYKITPSDIDNSELKFMVSDTSIASYNEHTQKLSMNKPGSFKFTVQARYNSEVKLEYNIRILCEKHTVVTDKAVAATCETAGKTEGSHCTVCGEVIVDQKEVPATGHTKVTDKEVAATCTKAGKTEGSHCSVCGEVIVDQKEVPATGHTKVTDKEVAATCTEAGKTEGSHCTVCGEVIVAQKEVSKKTHSYVTATTEATTAKNGLIVKKCSNCGDIAGKTEIAYPRYIILSKTKFIYNGKTQKPRVTIKDSNGKVIASNNYTVTYAKSCKNAGQYSVMITFKGNYSGTVTKTLVIDKATNTMNVKPASKIVKYAALKKKAQKIKLIVAKNNGKVSYNTTSKNLSVKNGEVTLKKGTKKGKYTVRVTAKGDGNHNAKTVKVKIIVK